VVLSDLAEESGTSPAQISQWVKAALESLEEAFSGELRKTARKHRKDLSKKEERIRQLEEVVSDLSTEFLRLKNLEAPVGNPMVRRRWSRTWSKPCSF
jgi:transposase-like protein